MKNHIFKKEYIALLNGNLPENSGTISAPIARKTDSIIERCVDFDNGEAAVTHYNVIKSLNNNISMVHFILETGRTHQIRVHSAYLNAPILGDSLYGNISTFISRQALHAFKVSFVHPITKEILRLEAEIPDDINSLCSN